MNNLEFQYPWLLTLLAFVRGRSPEWARWSDAGVARVYDTPVHDEPDAYASVAPLR